MKPTETAIGTTRLSERHRAPPVSSWWRRAVFYEIYPRSFQDSDGDGVGDLKGITSRLDHLQELGIDAIWIAPFYPSPQVDFGYDISDYQDVDPQFGTLADFDELLAEAHARQIRVVIDLVLNHTSDQHTYFLASRSSRDSRRRDWYIWRDGVDGGPPNNWSSVFGPCASTFDDATGQYYYHCFYSAQPDLNWRNPKVEAAMFRCVQFWLDRGVDGFRLDAVNWLFEDPELRDNPQLRRLRPGGHGERAQQHVHNCNLPETHEVLRRLRSLVDAYTPERVLIGEIWAPNVDDLALYHGANDDEIQLPFNFFLTLVPRLDATAFRKEVRAAERAFQGRLPSYVLSNHDLRRAYDRYGRSRHAAAIAKLLAAMLLTLRGVPFIYYGEEIGMPTSESRRIEDVSDPVGRRYWPADKGRDGQRTPMQWNRHAGAGFTTGVPWLPIPGSSRRRNVEAAAADPDSILSFYRELIALRRRSPALLEGGYAELGEHPHVFAYRRRARRESLLVALNVSAQRRMSAKRRRLSLDSGADWRGEVRLSSARPTGATLQAAVLTLSPYEALVVEEKTVRAGRTDLRGRGPMTKDTAV